METGPKIITLPASSVGPPVPLFRAEIHEIAGTASAAVAWAMLEVPADTPGTVRGNRRVYSHTYDAPQRVPARGRVSLKQREAPVLTFDYRTQIPSVRPRGDDSALSASLTALGLSGGVVRLEQPDAADEIEAEYPGYGLLPRELWVQLNPITEAYVVQLKLARLPPEDISQDFATQTYYVYGVTRFVVHALEAGAPAPESDTDKALAI
jgi:hypothetical protein